MSLQQLLAQTALQGPEYGDGLSSHLPMALVALHRLGADEARLHAFAAGYVRRLPPAPPAQPWPSGDDWTGRLGDFSAWPAYRRLFTDWLRAEGSDAMLRQVLPRLMPGCAAVAFHGAIRVAYAVEAGLLSEMADSLAYWACRYQPLGPLPELPGRLVDPQPLLRGLRAGVSVRPLIAQRMADAACNPALHAAIARLAIDGQTLQRLARLAAQAYAGSGNFTALHLLTACHAMRVLQGYLDEPLPALRWFWQAWATGVVTAGLRALPPVALLPWRRIVPVALASDDEHLIKLVDSCRAEAQAYGGDGWRRAASRAVWAAAAVSTRRVR
jgi:hypothetical protein